MFAQKRARGLLFRVMTRRTREDRPPSEDGDRETVTYSLWTAPPSSWQSPVELELSQVDLQESVSQLGLSRAEEDEQTKAFKTPVTA